jgi:hypothetical protein
LKHLEKKKSIDFREIKGIILEEELEKELEEELEEELGEEDILSLLLTSIKGVL